VIPLLVDHNFNERIVDGLTRRLPTLDMVLLRDAGLASAIDPVVLEWAASEGRVLRTHDRKTIPTFARMRVKSGRPMPGDFLVSDAMPIGQAIDELQIAVQCVSQEECENVITFFPM
jgi:hypothetical protein